jgi:hypothetical protein
MSFCHFASMRGSAVGLNQDRQLQRQDSRCSVVRTIGAAIQGRMFCGQEAEVKSLLPCEDIAFYRVIYES